MKYSIKAKPHGQPLPVPHHTWLCTPVLKVSKGKLKFLTAVVGRTGFHVFVMQQLSDAQQNMLSVLSSFQLSVMQMKCSFCRGLLFLF